MVQSQSYRCRESVSQPPLPPVAAIGDRRGLEDLIILIENDNIEYCKHKVSDDPTKYIYLYKPLSTTLARFIATGPRGLAASALQIVSAMAALAIEIITQWAAIWTIGV